MIPDEILKIPLISRDLGLMCSEKHKPFTLQMTREKGAYYREVAR